jgi:hypothetical protein
MKDKIPNLELAEPVELVAHERIRSLHSLNQTTNDYSGGITEIGSELDLGEYWRSIRKHLWLIAGITLLVTTLAGIVQQDPFDGVLRGVVEAAAGLGGFALLGRFLGLRR